MARAEMNFNGAKLAPLKEIGASKEPLLVV
jgi:hypothetical protein